MLRAMLLLLLLSITAVISHRCTNPIYECPDDATCCLLTEGEYGCCPMKDAVCCEDGLHCCPSGQTCDVEAQTCLGESAQRWIRKNKAKKHPISRNIAAKNDIICPGGRARCPPETTCCMLLSGNYGCCPTPEAVCCEDHLHCCPNGFRCDTSSSRCFAENEIEYPRKCGEQQGCGRQDSCCLQYDLDEGSPPKLMCCPLRNGVCCQHSCCPSGYYCVGGDRCVKRARSGKSSDYNLFF